MQDLTPALVTFGEAMVRLTPPAGRRLEQAHVLDVFAGGAELNVAVGASRLGLASRWVSRLPDNALGRLITSQARAHGVDVDHVQWARDGRAGLYFAESGASPRAASVLYDRAGSAISAIAPGAIDWPAAFAGASWFHVSGITPALSDSAAAVTAEAISAAKSAGLTVSYDLNYRKKLWTPDRARAVQEPFMRMVDVLVTTEEDARVVLGATGGRASGEFASIDAPSFEPVARSLQDRFHFKAVAMTLRENPRVWQNAWSAFVLADGTRYDGPRYEVEIVDRIGAGDAFSAGVIFGALTFKNDWQTAVRFGTAFSALKHGIPGDFCLSSRAEVEDVLKGAGLRVQR